MPWVYPYDADIVLSNYTRPEQQEILPFTEEDAARLKDALENTLVKYARENPETRFFVYFPPYSVLTWDQDIRQGAVRNCSVASLVCSVYCISTFSCSFIYAFSSFSVVSVGSVF